MSAHHFCCITVYNCVKYVKSTEPNSCWRCQNETGILSSFRRCCCLASALLILNVTLHAGVKVQAVRFHGHVFSPTSDELYRNSSTFCSLVACISEAVFEGALLQRALISLITAYKLH